MKLLQLGEYYRQTHKNTTSLVKISLRLTSIFLSFIQLFPTPCENPHYHLPDVVRMQKAGAVPALKACGSDAAGADLRLWIHPRLHNYSCILQIFNFSFRCKKRPASAEMSTLEESGHRWDSGTVKPEDVASPGSQSVSTGLQQGQRLRLSRCP